MTIKLYGSAGSTCSRRVITALEEKGLPYELVTIDLIKGEQKSAAHLARQPFGVIPALEDGDIHIFESRAILRYIATAYADKGTDLLGKDIKTKAQSENWLEVDSNYYNGPISAIVGQTLFNKWRGLRIDEAVVAAKLEEWSKVLDVYEARLAKQNYLAGDEFTMADLSHLPYTHYGIMACPGVTTVLDRHPNVKAWWERISTRPSWIKVSQMH